MSRNFTARVGTQSNPFDMGKQLAVEESHKENVILLFMGHKVEDISALAEHRKSGTDFLLHPFLHDGAHGPAIRCENKFEGRMTGNACLEYVSVDRGSFTPGWLLTSTAAWLNHWYPTGELLSMHMDELRAYVFNNYKKFGATTARNKRYLSWNFLVDVNELVRELKSARIVNAHKELGISPAELGPAFNGASRRKLCSSDELVRHMQEYSRSSTPLQLPLADIQAICRVMVSRDKMQKYNIDMLHKLSWLHG